MKTKLFRIGYVSQKDRTAYVINLLRILHLSISAVNINGAHINFGFGLLGYEFNFGFSKWKKYS